MRMDYFVGTRDLVDGFAANERFQSHLHLEFCNEYFTGASHDIFTFATQSTILIYLSEIQGQL